METGAGRMDERTLLELVAPIVLKALRPSAPELTRDDIVPELSVREKGDEISSMEIIMDLEDRFGVEFTACDPDAVMLVRDAMYLARTAIERVHETPA
jgi:acyl carrier protein